MKASLVLKAALSMAVFTFGVVSAQAESNSRACDLIRDSRIHFPDRNTFLPNQDVRNSTSVEDAARAMDEALARINTDIKENLPAIAMVERYDRVYRQCLMELRSFYQDRYGRNALSDSISAMLETQVIDGAKLRHLNSISTYRKHFAQLKTKIRNEWERLSFSPQRQIYFENFLDKVTRNEMPYYDPNKHTADSLVDAVTFDIYLSSYAADRVQPEGYKSSLVYWKNRPPHGQPFVFTVAPLDYRWKEGTPKLSVFNNEDQQIIADILSLNMGPISVQVEVARFTGPNDTRVDFNPKTEDFRIVYGRRLDRSRAHDRGSWLAAKSPAYEHSRMVTGEDLRRAMGLSR